MPKNKSPPLALAKTRKFLPTNPLNVASPRKILPKMAENTS